jgi:hypothetical protein
VPFVVVLAAPGRRPAVGRRERLRVTDVASTRRARPSRTPQ